MDSFLTYKHMIKIKGLFESYLFGYNYVTKQMNSNNYIYIIEDSLILLMSFVPNFFSQYDSANAYLSEYRINRYLEEDYTGDNFESFSVEEVTPNEIGFKFNGSQFSREAEACIGIEYLHIHIGYTRFKGYKRVYWCMDRETTAEYVSRAMPELCLRERYNAWPGNLYNFIIYEFTAYDGSKHFAVDYTICSPQKIVLKTGRNYIKTGRFLNKSFEKAIMTWKNKRRYQRLEENLSYCIIQEYIKENDDVWRRARELVDMAKEHRFDDIDKTPYHTPANKWISEESVYLLTKKLYNNYKVIYQHRPFYLKSSSGGQMSFDVYISGLNVAIEYQGKQHFEPVDFFGGIKGFEALKKRDKEKANICDRNGVKLVYINYWEEITPELIKAKIESTT